MRRFLLALTLIILLTAACDRPVPPTTPTPTATATADVTLPPNEPTADPTPTREVLPIDTLDCNTLQIHQDFPPVNADPCLLAPHDTTRLFESADNRHQAHPVSLRPRMWLGPVADTPFWVNRSSSPRGYRLEITEVDGTFGYEFLFPTTLTNERSSRYIIKVGAVLSLGGVPDPETVFLSVNLGFDTRSDLLELTPQEMPTSGGVISRGYHEWVWVIENGDPFVTMSVGAYFHIQYAGCVGECFITFQQIAVLSAPDDFGSDAVIDVP